MEPRFRGMFSEVMKIFELVLVLPATNATSERSFSKLKLIKTTNRASMSQERLPPASLIAALEKEPLLNTSRRKQGSKNIF